MATNYDPYDLMTALRLRKTASGSTAIPAVSDGTTDTGIPAGGAYTPYEDGGFTGGKMPGPTEAPGLPTTGISNPNPTLIPDTATTSATPAATPSYAPYAMPGWDQTKWANPAHSTIKYQAGRIFRQFDPNAIRQDPTPLLAALKAAGLKVTMVGDDKIDFGDGYGPIDVITREGQWAWQPTTGQGDASASAGASVWGAPGGGAGSQASGAGNTAFDAAIKAMVLKLMGQQPTNMSTDPVYKGAMDAYGVEQQRAKERERNAISERMAAEGTLNTGGFSDRIMGAEQQQGENMASFAGNLGIRELERQRDEIMQALQIGASLMTDEQRLALTEKLGLINANLQQQGITNQNNQFNQNLGWDQDQFQWLQNLIPFA